MNTHIGLINEILIDEVVKVHISNNSSNRIKEKCNNYKTEDRRERKMYTVHEIGEEMFFYHIDNINPYP